MAFSVAGCAAMNALAGAAGLFERDAAHGGLGLFFDVGFTFRVATPPGESETVLDGLLEFLVIGWFDGIRFAERESAIEERLLNFFQHLRDGGGNSLLRDEGFAFFSGTVAPGQHYRALRDILGAEFQAQRHAAHLPVVEFEAGAYAFALVDLDADSGVRPAPCEVCERTRGRWIFPRRFCKWGR